jgi:quinone-modifying oxidoreductase subunit QmoC
MEYIEGDPKFVRQIMDAGGGTLKRCFQCATCSVICPLSPDDKPFPRKEMIWAQWGLKDRLLKDADIWLCHQCNDCSSYCPRQAKPGEVLGALRSCVVAHYSFPSFIARAFQEPKYLLAIIAVPVILLAAFFYSFGFEIPEGEIIFSHFIPHQYIEIAGTIVGGYVAITILTGLYRFWRSVSESDIIRLHHIFKTRESEKSVDYAPQARGYFIPSFISALIEILKHSRFKKCEESKYRYYAHLAIFYGFIIIGISTVGALGYLMAGEELALPLTDPVKILGNIGAALLFAGCTWVIYGRVTKKDAIGIGSYSDWFFICVLYIVAITGILTEAMRLAQVAVAAYSLYMVHLVAVFTLLTYAPHSKFAHLAYRAIAMTYAKFSGRDIEVEEFEW